MKLQVKDLELFEDCYSKTNEEFNALFKMYPESYTLFRLLLKVLINRKPRNAGQELFGLLYEDASRDPEYTSFNVHELFSTVRSASFPGALRDFLSGVALSIEDDLYMAFVRIKETYVYTFIEEMQSKPVTETAYFISTRIPYNGNIKELYMHDYDNSGAVKVRPPYKRTGIEVTSVQLKWDTWEALLKALLKKSNWEEKNYPNCYSCWNFKQEETYDKLLEEFKNEHHN